MSPGERKRKSLETEDERPSRLPREEEEPFSPSCELDPAQIIKGFSPRSHITGTVSSTWPVNINKTKKFLLRVHSENKLEVYVAIRSGDLSQLATVVPGSKLALLLENAESAYNYEDWYDTPATTSSAISLDEAPAMSDSLEERPLTPVTDIASGLQASGSHDDTFRTPMPPKFTPPAREFAAPSNPSPATHTTTSIAPTQPKGSVPGPPTAGQAGPSKPKRKRVRKRDTRHANNPTLQSSKEENKEKPNGQAKLQNKMGNIEKKIEDISRKTPKSEAQENKAISVKKTTAATAQKKNRPDAGFTNKSGTVHPALADLTENLRAHVAGIVVRADDPKQVRSGDWMVTYSITDPSVFPDTELSINFFRDKKEALPTAKLGEAILIKQLKITPLNSRLSAVGYKDNFSWAAFEPAHGREYTGPFMSLKMDQVELGYCLELIDWWREKRDATNAGQNTAETSFTQVAKKRREQVELKDMKDNVFCDCLVQVVKMWPDSRTTDLYVTDFTENPGFGDPKQSNLSLPGIQALPLPNSFVCKITLWDEVNKVADVIQPLQFFKLKNVRVRWGRGGNLEGSMGMGKDGKEIFVRIPESDDSLKALRKRKIAFLKGGSEALSRTTSATDLPRFQTSRSLTPVPQIPPAIECCVSGMRQGGFYTFTAEVLKAWRAVNIDDYYVTDYTEHPYLMDFSSVEQWRPPPGRRTLQVSVFDDVYRGQAAGLTTGCFVRFEYMLLRKTASRKKLGDGKEDPPLLAGKIGEVVQRPCSITILPNTDPTVKALLRRKADVLKIDIEIPHSPPPKASSILGQEGSSTDSPPPKHDEIPFDLTSEGPGQAHLGLCSVSPPASEAVPNYRRNIHGSEPLRSIFHNMPHSTLAMLRHASNQSMWKVRARIVSFQPGRLRDWVWQQCLKCHRDVPINQRTCSDCMRDDDENDTLLVPRWRFAFVLQDEQGDTLPEVFCCDEVATTFLGELFPEILVSNRDTLNILRSRVSPLLGNLERVQLHLLKAEEEWQRRQCSKGKVQDDEPGKPMEHELEVDYGQWGDWTLRCWMDREEARFGVFGCGVVI
ncbi:hypothetical protein DACRYDRAFT_113994 [Dacryopinax primogenitus]|uniref:Protection of telomeres protein 1 n=1 Tax=Dacryopinax primogenitus (strain DJM 731) TaxID=1858805 RepID=M5G797_DACPD|nr:uncharacterized protein DACRYDRAFT_113994 [Dacryopinax primogenitus]EJU04609.1 hypothetical protein DACRYDRAFT_113994 [Dacryopinax primogenitus]